jgi:hypothetical protein
MAGEFLRHDDVIYLSHLPHIRVIAFSQDKPRLANNQVGRVPGMLERPGWSNTKNQGAKDAEMQAHHMHGFGHGDVSDGFVANPHLG